MKDVAEKKLKQLREELELGQRQLAVLDGRAAELRSTLLRISGAIQVLEEVLGDSAAARPAPTPLPLSR
jgi:hypothetical protein